MKATCEWGVDLTQANIYAYDEDDTERWEDQGCMDWVLEYEHCASHWEAQNFIQDQLNKGGSRWKVR